MNREDMFNEMLDILRESMQPSNDEILAAVANEGTDPHAEAARIRSMVFSAFQEMNPARNS